MRRNILRGVIGEEVERLIAGFRNGKMGMSVANELITRMKNWFS